MRQRRFTAIGFVVAFFACQSDGPTGADTNGNQNGGNGDQRVVTSVVITPGAAILLAKGATVQPTATAHDSSGSTISGKTFVWTSSDSTAFAVNAAGLVTPVTNALSDSATISAATEGVTGTTKIDLIRADVIEALIAQSFSTWWMGTQDGNPAMALSATADEFTASWGNYGIRQLSSEPRTAWPNTPTFQYAGFNEDPWFAIERHAATAIEQRTGPPDR